MKLVLPLDEKMHSEVIEIIDKVKTFTPEERDELFREIMHDPDLREDLIDMALILQAEAEGGEPVTLEELESGKRTYSAG